MNTPFHSVFRLTHFMLPTCQSTTVSCVCFFVWRFVPTACLKSERSKNVPARHVLIHGWFFTLACAKRGDGVLNAGFDFCRYVCVCVCVCCSTTLFYYVLGCNAVNKQIHVNNNNNFWRTIFFCPSCFWFWTGRRRWRWWRW